jgi:hypothetical protein
MHTLVGRATPIQKDEARRRFLQSSDRKLRDLNTRLRFAIRDKDKKNEEQIRKLIATEKADRKRALEIDRALRFEEASP